VGARVRCPLHVHRKATPPPPPPLASRPVSLSLSLALALSLRGRCAQPTASDRRSGCARRSPMAMAGAGAAAAAAKRCMNPACGALPASSVVVGAGGDWRKGWPLRSGGFALLCDKCGYGLPPPPCPLCCLSDSYAPSAPPAARLPNGGAPRLDGWIASCRSASHPLLRLDALPSPLLSTSFFLDNIYRGKEDVISYEYLPGYLLIKARRFAHHSSPWIP
jgi:hypothetical protein